MVMKNQNNLFCKSHAEFSEDRVYRYLLSREWDVGPKLNFIMLNPSTADENFNDPTIERCMRRAQRWGYGSIVITNLFALRSTDPHGLYEAEDPIGPDNDNWIVEASRQSDLIICAWGSFVARFRDGRRQRSKQVVELLNGRKVMALKVSKSGEPSHPLYVNYDIKPEEWRPYETA